MDRQVVKDATERAEQKIKSALVDVRASVQSQLAAILRKDDQAPPPDREEAQKRAEAIVAEINLDALNNIENSTADSMIMVSIDASNVSLQELGFEDGDPIFGRASAAATNWSRENAAKLVSELDPSTRDMLRSAIADGIENGTPTSELASLLSDTYAFSEERAALIARTEIAMANGGGALQSYIAAASTGLHIEKEWLLSLSPCNICIDNASVGSIPLNERFPSGDITTPAHPRCECVVSPVVIDD